MATKTQSVVHVTRVCRSHPFGNVGTLSSITTVDAFAPMAEQVPAPGYETFAYGLVHRTPLIAAWIDHYQRLGLDTMVLEMVCEFPGEVQIIDLTDPDIIKELFHTGHNPVLSHITESSIDWQHFDIAQHLWVLPSVMRGRRSIAAIHWIELVCADGEIQRYKAITLDTSRAKSLKPTVYNNYDSFNAATYFKKLG